MRNVKCYQGGARSSTGAGCNSTIELAPNSKVVKTRHLVSVFLDLGFFLQYLSTQPTYLQILRWCFRGQKEEKGSPSFAGRPRVVLGLIVKIRIFSQKISFSTLHRYVLKIAPAFHGGSLINVKVITLPTRRLLIVFCRLIIFYSLVT